MNAKGISKIANAELNMKQGEHSHGTCLAGARSITELEARFTYSCA